MNHVAVIGVGNPWRGDDAVGIFTARAIQSAVGARATVIESDGEVTSLLECFKSFNQVYIIDAIQTGSAKPGYIHDIDGIKESFKEASLRASTHVLGVAQSIEMARVLGRLPSKLRVFGIEAAQFEHGSSLSKEVRSASDAVARQIIQDIKKENEANA